MPVWLSAILTKVAEFELGKIVAWLKIQLKKYMAASKTANDEDANLKKYDDAVKAGNLDDQSKAGEDLLNGTSNPKP